MVIALVVVAVVVAGAATAGVRLLAFHRPASLSVGIAASSALPPAGGDDVYVRYRDGTQASARISGQVSGAKPARSAGCTPSPSPTTMRRSRPAPPVAPGRRHRQLHVYGDAHPGTRYQVKLFKNSAAARPLATSRPATLYVAVGGITGNAHKCRRPLCH